MFLSLASQAFSIMFTINSLRTMRTAWYFPLDVICIIDLSVSHRFTNSLNVSEISEANLSSNPEKSKDLVSSNACADSDEQEVGSAASSSCWEQHSHYFPEGNIPLTAMNDIDVQLGIRGCSPPLAAGPLPPLTWTWATLQGQLPTLCLKAYYTEQK